MSLTHRPFKDLWNLAGRISSEVSFRTALEMSRGAAGWGDKSVSRLIQRAKNSARMTKIIMSIMFLFLSLSLVATLLFSGEPNYPNELLRTTIISSNLLFGFFFILIFGMMSSNTFISSGAISALTSLPLTKRDFNTLAMLSFLRMFDVPLVVLLVTFPLGYTYVTKSLLGGLAAFFFSATNLGLAVTCMLGLAHLFYTRIQSLGGSRLKSFARGFFTILWGLAYFLIYQLPNMINWFLLPLIIEFGESLSSFSLILMFVYPFSNGYIVAFLTSFQFEMPLLVIGSGFATSVYVILSIIGVRWSLKTITRAATGDITQVSTQVTGSIEVNIQSISRAIISKDLKVASRTPSYVMIFLLPMIMLISMAPVLLAEGTVPPLMVLGVIGSTSAFYPLYSVMFLNIESKGISYTLTLPLGTKTVIKAKALLQASIYLILPLILTILMLVFRVFTDPTVVLISLIQVLGVYAGSMMSLGLISKIFGGGRLAAFDLSQGASQLFLTTLAGGVFSVLPLFGYFFFFLTFSNELIAILILTIIGILDILIVNIINNRMLKD